MPGMGFNMIDPGGPEAVGDTFTLRMFPGELTPEGVAAAGKLAMECVAMHAAFRDLEKAGLGPPFDMAEVEKMMDATIERAHFAQTYTRRSTADIARDVFVEQSKKLPSPSLRRAAGAILELAPVIKMSALRLFVDCTDKVSRTRCRPVPVSREVAKQHIEAGLVASDSRTICEIQDHPLLSWIEDVREAKWIQETARISMTEVDRLFAELQSATKECDSRLYFAFDNHAAFMRDLEQVEVLHEVLELGPRPGLLKDANAELAMADVTHELEPIVLAKCKAVRDLHCPKCTRILETSEYCMYTHDCIVVRCSACKQYWKAEFPIKDALKVNLVQWDHHGLATIMGTPPEAFVAASRDKPATTVNFATKFIIYTSEHMQKLRDSVTLEYGGEVEPRQEPKTETWRDRPPMI